MNIQKIIFLSGKNKLSGNLLLPKPNAEIGLLFLHGGGYSNKERYREIQQLLQQNGFASFAFDFQGVGESEGTFQDGSLKNRGKDAEAAFDMLQQHVKKIVVVGLSMGGHIAVQLTNTRNTEALMLLFPAAYAKEAEDKLLNGEFTKILRTEHSWKNSPVFPIIAQYSRKILIVYGEHDEVIPKVIQQQYKDSIKSKGIFSVVPHATHGLLSPENELQEKAKQTAFKKFINFLKTLELVN